MTTLPVLLGVALLSAALAEGWRRWALRRGVMDLPGGRSSHAVATPRGAGVGVVAALLVGMAVMIPATGERHAAMLSIGMVAALGLLDDLRPLPPMLKLFGQACAAIPMALVLPWPAALSPIEFAPGLAVAASLAFTLLAVNAWNFMDGINGIASLAAVVVALLAVVAAIGTDGALLGLLLAAAALGFLPLNFPQARVFMGDSGSHGLGMTIAALVLWPGPSLASMAAIAAASPFLIDVLGTLLRRARDGERLTQAHRRHLYQLVTRSGYSHARVTSAYAVWMVASGGCVVAMGATGGRDDLALASVMALNAALWWLATRRFERLLRREGHW